VRLRAVEIGDANLPVLTSGRESVETIQLLMVEIMTQM
jgi:hypothetical protein